MCCLEAHRGILIGNRCCPIGRRIRPTSVVRLGFGNSRFQAPRARCRPAPRPELGMLFRGHSILMIGGPTNRGVRPGRPLRVKALLGSTTNCLGASSTSTFVIRHLSRTADNTITVTGGPVIIPVLSHHVDRKRVRHRCLTLITKGVAPSTKGFS